MTTVFAFLFTRLFVGLPVLAPVASAVLGFGWTVASGFRQLHRPARARARVTAGEGNDAERAASLLVRQAVRCSTTLQRLGASQQDQYNLAAACYVDLTAMFGVESAEEFRQRHSQIFDRKRNGHDAAMLALGQDLRQLADRVDHGEIAVASSEDSARHIDARLKGFMHNSEPRHQP